MNLKNILIYGDSNTWGYIPVTMQRYLPEVRYTGVVARELGEEYHIIEEGLEDRTTVFDDHYDGNRNGLKTLPAILLSHRPLDAVVIMLGSNDLKYVSAFKSAQGAGKLAWLTKNANTVLDAPSPVWRNVPRVLLVSPIQVGKNVAKLNPYTNLKFAHEESLNFHKEFSRVAKEREVEYLNAAEFARPSKEDAVHMDPENHKKLGIAIANKIKEMFAE